MPAQMANLSIAKGISPALITLITLAALSTILHAAAQPTPPSRCANDQPFNSTNGTCVCNQVTAAALSCGKLRLVVHQFKDCCRTSPNWPRQTRAFLLIMSGCATRSCLPVIEISV